VPINQLWAAFAVFLLAGCSSTSKIMGSDDAASDGQGGSSGTAQAGSSGASGAAGSGSGGTGVAGSSGSAGASGSAGSSGAAGSAGSPPDASVGGAGSGGSAGAGDGGVDSWCVPTDVTVDFAGQGTVRRARLDQRGVSLVGLADLQFSARDAGEPDAGLGVVGGYWDWSIDSSEFVTVTFTRPATNVKIFVTHALDVNNDSVYGKSAVTVMASRVNRSVSWTSPATARRTSPRFSATCRSRGSWSKTTSTVSRSGAYPSPLVWTEPDSPAAQARGFLHQPDELAARGGVAAVADAALGESDRLGVARAALER
jgi:hypothetical protein